MAQTQTFQPSSLDVNIPESLATSLLSLHSFSEVAALVNSAQVLPSQFVQPEVDRPGLAHDAFLPEFELPVIDFSLLAACRTQEERIRMSSVCKEWGFFQIVNHGVKPGLINKMESFGRSFFELPSATKEKVKGFRGKFDPSDMHSRFWLEAINVSPSLDEFRSGFVDVVWPDRSKELSHCYEEYLDSMEEVAQTIFELLIECLGVKASTIMEDIGGKGTSATRFCHYPPCPRPDLAMGLGAHTDPNVLTFLCQDEVGGLQLRAKDGEWRAVKPRRDAFVVNVGDSLRVLSNGAYRAAQHRVVLNSKKARMSFGFFYSPKQEVILKPLQHLVDGEHPPLFKPFNYSQYIEYRYSAGIGGNIDAYAGINV